MRKKWILHDNWKVKILNESKEPLSSESNKAIVNDWLDASVPGTVHTDLLNAGKIEEPFFEDNEKGLEWIGESDWIYQTEFDLLEEMDKENLFITFDGLDTIAHITLNGQSLGDTVNMFRRYRFHVSEYLKATGNKLEVRFESPLRIGRQLIDQYGRLFSVRNEERTYLRKSQYSFGWDWGPAFPTAGIWRPVYLEHLDGAWIESIRFDTTELCESSAKVLVKVDLTTEIEGAFEVKCNLIYNDQNMSEVKSASKNSSSDARNRVATNANPGTMEFEFEVQNPALWWPNGLGDQPLYDLDITLSQNGSILDQAGRKVGIRTIELIQQEGDKQVFYFRVNDKPVYLKGANWIPSDSFIPQIKDSTYKSLVFLARDAGMNVLRIWGGGIYEQPIFYELCDQLGVLIWQDFMFACSAYPDNDFFVENIRKEVKEKISDLQYHPSITIWCGNNENEWIWYRVGKGSYTNMPGYKLFHHDLKNIAGELDPLRPYWPTTPFGFEDDPNSIESGNRHSWDIWSRWLDYKEVENDASLFVSEFGFQGPANINTLNSVLKKENRHIQDEIFEFHNKQDEGNERLFKFLAGHLPVSTDWEDFIYLTQLNQGFALKTCLDHWRGRWPETAGSIIWQLNDCWPVTSWSLVDSYLDPKLAYYFVQKSFRDPAIFIKYIDDQVSIKLVNDTITDFVGSIEHNFIDLTDNQVIKKEKVDVTLQNGDRNQGYTISLGDLPETGNWILITTLRNKQDYIINRNFFTLKRWKHLKTPASNVTIAKSGQGSLSLIADSLALFVDLYHQDARFSDRGFIMLPGEKKDLDIISGDPGNVEVDDIRIFSLNDYLHK
jgi:beta-mannosidase